MRLRTLSGRTILLLGITAAAVVVGGLNLQARLRSPHIPSDGVIWADSSQGVKAEIVDPSGPAARAGVRRGDLLIGISLDGGRNFDEITRASDVQIYLDTAGVHHPVSYLVERRNAYGDASRWAADLIELHVKPQRLWRGLYLGAIGLVYLIIGLYVLIRQGRSPYTRHFYVICLAAFIVHFYSFTEQLDRLDWIVFLADNAALTLLAPLFLHFAALFPIKQHIVESRRGVTAVLYVPAMIMLGLEALLVTHWRPTADVALRLRMGLDSAEVIQFILCFLIGGALLVRTFTRAESPILRQQMKWVIWGLGVSIVPFTAYQVYSYFINPNASPVIEAIAVGPLIFIPLSFGYSIVRYRLMDVDVIMRRSVVHALATASVLVLYLVLLIKGADIVDWVVPNAPLWLVQAVTVTGMLIIAMLFAPVRTWLQQQMDRLFYGPRYGARASLGQFIQTISATTAFEPLLSSVAQRLGEMLPVGKIVIFVEDASAPAGYRIAFSSEGSEERPLPLEFADVIRTESASQGVLSVEVTPWLPESFLARFRDLHYFVPCIVRDRMVAIIGLGRNAEAPLLTSEEIELLRAISGYVAVAIENSLLYREQAARAAELAELKEFNESIIESINVGILAITPDGRITTCNSALEELLGLPRSRAIGQPIDAVLDPELVRALRQVVGHEGWVVDEARTLYKFRLVLGEDRDLVLNISLTPFVTPQGQNVGSLLVLEDLTHRVRLEEQLQQREKLSSIGLLAAGVAHEVNTPLAGIASYTQMLLRQFPPSDPRRTLLEKIQTQAMRASNIVTNLLNFARVERTDLAELDLHQVLDDTLQLIEPQLRTSGIVVVKEYAPELPAILGNFTKLQQVFMNLILNARDAMPDGGQLTLRTDARDAVVQVDVIDTGVGIPPEHLSKIYDPFFTTKEIGRGTGLGLALTYGIVQEHAGRISVESKVGCGTRFTLTFPAARVARIPSRRREEYATATGD